MTGVQVLLGIQELLKSPNLGDPAQQQAWEDFNMSRQIYDRYVLPPGALCKQPGNVRM